VAAELERRWEEALATLRTAQERLADDERRTPCWAIPADLHEALRDLGPRMPELWEDKLFSAAQKKALLRALIDKVVLHRSGGRRSDVVRVVWRGGAATECDVRVAVGSLSQLSDAKELDESVVRLAREGRTDEEIAAQLTSEGRRSPMSDCLLPSTVRAIRLRHRILRRESQSHPRRIAGSLTVPQLAERLCVPRHWIYDRIHNGTIRVAKDAATGSYLFPDKPEVLQNFKRLLTGDIADLGC